MGLRVVRLVMDGFPVLGDGLVQPALLLQREAEAVVGLRVVLLEPDGLAVDNDALVQPPLLPERDAQVEVSTGTLRSQSYRGRVVSECVLSLRPLHLLAC